MRNKFDALILIIKDKVDILVITETKFDDSFTDAQFSIVGFKAPVRLNRTASGGGIIVYIRDSIPSKFLGNLPSDKDKEGLFIELNLRNTKWILFAGYNPRRARISPFLSNIEHMLNTYNHSYDNIIIMGGFYCNMNENIENNSLLPFCETYFLKNMVTGPTCFKKPMKPTNIDVVLTNRKEYFTKTTLIETGLSDYQKMTVTCLKQYFKKLPPKNIFYRNHKNFDVNVFRNTLLNELLFIRDGDVSYDKIKDMLVSKLDTYALTKKRLVRANDAPYMNNALQKSIMTRSRLKKQIYERSNSRKFA